MDTNIKQNQGHRVLLIDDDKGFCLVVEKVAKKLGMDLSYITHISELATVGVLEDYDAIWIDYDLVETTGLEVAEALYEEHPSIPIVILSSTSRPFADDMKFHTNIKGILSKWDLTDDEITSDLLENSLGKFHSYKGLHTSEWQDQSEETVDHLIDHFDYEIPLEKYRA